MKQINISVSFDEEKLTALKRYMTKKKLDLDAELADALQKLYEKYVPALVREYIDEADTAAPAPPKSKRPAAKSAPQKIESEGNENGKC